MEVEEIQAAQACKFQRVVASANGRLDHDKINDTDDKQERDLKMVSSNNNNNNNNFIGVGANDDLGGSVNNRLRGLHHSSRIIRVSRASGGKDRHSKVWTSKGLRDRRVRLSVTTAIQFYDIQDRLGYDQPSKAVEWLINHASEAIAELPALNSPFPETPRQPSDEKRTSGDTEQGGLDSAEVELDGSDAAAAAASFQQQQHLSLPKSACSSTSETSKGSGLSLSRSDIRESRVKRRERARERTAKEKETTHHHHHQNVNPISQNSSFTELLTGGGGGGGISIVSNHAASPTGSSAHLEPNFFQKQQQQPAARQWPTAPMDYFGSHSSAFPGHIHLGNSLSQAFSVQAFNNGGGESHSELQHFPFVTDHHLMSTTSACNNFSISCSPSSGLAGFINNNNNSRGTLQSNSSSPSFMMPHLQRFPAIDGSSSNFPFFIGTATAAPPMENHHQHQHHQFPSGLQLYYTDGNSRHSDHKGKGKN